MEHEEWYFTRHHYDQRVSALINDWVRDRAELLNRAKLVFAEAMKAAEVEQEKQRQHWQQQDLCRDLYLKVRYSSTNC